LAPLGDPYTSAVSSRKLPWGAIIRAGSDESRGAMVTDLEVTDAEGTQQSHREGTEKTKEFSLVPE
jgi:hypothetical protein